MAAVQSVPVRELLNKLDLSVKHGADFIDRKIITSEVARPGLLVAGYFENHPHERIQLLGKTETVFILKQSTEQRRLICQNLCHEATPVIILSKGAEIIPELEEYAKAAEIPVLRARSKTSRVLANVTNFLEGRLAERLSKHGVFVEVFGMGVMLTGGSGVGKSETALELVQRGHRLIADDRVELFQLDELTLIGEAPEILQNLVEIRGLGIVDVMSLYGVAAIRRSKRVELIIDLVLDDGTVEYDRLGTKSEFEKIFDVNVPKVRIPVKTGRNLSAIIESAAMNFRASEMGYDATIAFNKKLETLIMNNREA